MIDDALRPICFMVMPFGVKPTGLGPGEGPAKIDFQSLWFDALEPAIADLGYEPVRADEELDPARPTAVVCAGGYRSAAAASLLQRHGFAQLYNIIGGTSAWESAGYAVER